MEQIESELAALKEAARATAEAATHEESKPENEYDTRALEASYLAGAQSKRIVEMEAVLGECKQLRPRTFKAFEPIAATALVRVRSNKKEFTFLLLNKGGGMTVEVAGQKIQIITPQSPLGEALLGQKVGDTAVVEKSQQTLEYEILSIA